MIKRFTEPVFMAKNVEKASIYIETSDYVSRTFWYYNDENPMGDLIGELKYQKIVDSDKIMFTKGAPFPSSMFNKLGTPIKKVVKNPTKIIVPNNTDDLWRYCNVGYILKTNNINVFVNKYAIDRKTTITDIAKAYNATSIIKGYFIRTKKDADILEMMSQHSDKLVSHYDFIKYLWSNLPKLDSDTWESIKALLESGDSNNVKIASDLLFQFDFSKYLIHIKYAVHKGVQNMSSRYTSLGIYLDPVRNYTTFKYLSYIIQLDWAFLSIPLSCNKSHYNLLHDFYNKLLSINEKIDSYKLPEKYKIEV